MREFTGHRWIPRTKASDTDNVLVFFYLCLNKLLSKQSWGWWLKTPSHSLWRHTNALIREKTWWVRKHYESFGKEVIQASQFLQFQYGPQDIKYSASRVFTVYWIFNEISAWHPQKHKWQKPPLAKNWIQYCSVISITKHVINIHHSLMIKSMYGEHFPTITLHCHYMSVTSPKINNLAVCWTDFFHGWTKKEQ